MQVSKAALAAALTLGTSGVFLTSVAEAQRAPATSRDRQERQQQGQQQQGQQAQAQAQQGAQLNLSREERAALQPLSDALTARNWAAAQAALPAAQAAAQGPDARYYVARATWQVGNQTQNVQLERQGLDALIALPNLPANELTAFLNRQAELAFSANDFAKAEAAFQRLSQLNPTDQRVLNNLAIVRSRMGNSAGAMEVLQRTVDTAEAAGQKADEQAYRRLLAAAVQARQTPLILTTANRLVAAYPNATNFRDALLLLRQHGGLDAQANLDIYRLQRAADALRGEGDYILFAQDLNRGGLVGEAKAVLDEGVARSQISTSNQFVRDLSTSAGNRITQDRAGLAAQQRQAQGAANGRMARGVADALFGYGRYADAAAMYRLALQKGGEDANLINTRLGASLALAGQRAEAEAALRAVTGARQPLAGYWLVWLANRAG